MKIKDIVNRDIVNLTNCEHEPIHIPGSIQPQGFLIAVHAESLLISFCSANIVEYLGVEPTDVLGSPIDTVFGSNISEYLGGLPSHNLPSIHPNHIVINGKNFSCLMHQSGSNIIIECEPDPDDQSPLADIYDQTSRFLSYMHQTSTLQELCEMVARGTREITGYDRVMIYRFDKDYNGEVIAEDRREDLEPFLGLHYPHTDIPAQARDLYLKNLLRLIYDINYTPVPILTSENNIDTTLDLSQSILRSTSPIHVQYLQNMGVGATLTISLIHHGKLWGLIACHHYSPKNLTPECRLAAQLQGHFITSQIDVRQSNEEYEVSRAVNKALETVSAIELTSDEEDLAKIMETEDLLKICGASSAAIIFNNQIYRIGQTPSDEDILTLANWISTYSGNTQFYTDKLYDFLPDSKTLCTQVAGILYHSLGNEGSNCIMWFRPETIAEVFWAGDPAKAIIKDQKGLSPRNSFELWKETVKCVSKPWLQPELNAAANFAHLLQKHASFLVLSQEEAKYRKLSEILKETNSELENINWISTHDLQEPLRKMQLISSRVLLKEKNSMSDKVVESLDRINNSANRMQNLLVDILKYTRINHNEDFSEVVDLNTILSNVLHDINDLIVEKNVQITAGHLPTIKAVPFLLKQLFSNLILNSIKYVAPDTTPIIEISTEQTTGAELGDEFDKGHYYVIEIKDHGIGFDPQFASSIFNIFTRLHGQGEYTGSGVGLALCKKIMQTHGGAITADGKLGGGATFRIYFPINK